MHNMTAKLACDFRLFGVQKFSGLGTVLLAVGRTAVKVTAMILLHSEIIYVCEVLFGLVNLNFNDFLHRE